VEIGEREVGLAFSVLTRHEVTVQSRQGALRQFEVCNCNYVNAEVDTFTDAAEGGTDFADSCWSWLQMDMRQRVCNRLPASFPKETLQA
jgi:hypothetical protein